MTYSENINSPNNRNEIPNSNINFLQEGLSDNYFLASNELLNKKLDKDEKKSAKNIINSNSSSRNKKLKISDIYSQMNKNL